MTAIWRAPLQDNYIEEGRADPRLLLPQQRMPTARRPVRRRRRTGTRRRRRRRRWGYDSHTHSREAQATLVSQVVWAAPHLMSYSPSRQRMPKPLLSGGCENSPRMHPESECRCNAAKTLPRSRLRRNDDARGLLLYDDEQREQRSAACVSLSSLSFLVNCDCCEAAVHYSTPSVRPYDRPTELKKKRDQS